MKLVSFDIKADFGVLRKPDVNSVYLTYNMLHKPCLLGILGAIVGLSGFQEGNDFPDYYVKLKDLKIGIQPLPLENKGNFLKAMVRYINGVGVSEYGTWIIDEQILIKPSYRCFIELDLKDELQNKLYEYIKNYKSVFIPYLGKNECSLWWEEFQEYEYHEFDYAQDFKIDSIFTKGKDNTLKDSKQDKGIVSILDRSSFSEDSFIYFETLPYMYDDSLKQYAYKPFSYTSCQLNKERHFDNLYQIQSPKSIIQLF